MEIVLAAAIGYAFAGTLPAVAAGLAAVLAAALVAAILWVRATPAESPDWFNWRQQQP